MRPEINNRQSPANRPLSLHL